MNPMDAVYAFLTALGSGAIGWFFSRKQLQNQNKSIEIDNAIKNASYYQNLLDDMVVRYEKTLNELQQATQTIREQEKQIQELMDNIHDLTLEIRKYKQLNGKS